MSGIWYRIRAAKKNIMGISQFCSSASMPTAHTRSPMTTPMPRGTMKRRSLRSFPLMSAMSAMSLSYTPKMTAMIPPLAPGIMDIIPIRVPTRRSFKPLPTMRCPIGYTYITKMNGCPENSLSAYRHPRPAWQT